MLAEKIKSRGLNLVTPNFDVVNHRFDVEFDRVPYMTSGVPHLEFEIDGHVCTSLMFIIEKPLPRDSLSR
jgi:hypothetical protein